MGGRGEPEVAENDIKAKSAKLYLKTILMLALVTNNCNPDDLILISVVIVVAWDCMQSYFCVKSF